MPWLPNDLSEKALHKIIKEILSEGPYTSYIYYVGNSQRVLVNSDALLKQKIVPYLHLVHPKREDPCFVRVYVINQRKIVAKEKSDCGGSRRSVDFENLFSVTELTESNKADS